MSKKAKMLWLIVSLASLSITSNLSAKGGGGGTPVPPAPPAVPIPLEATLVGIDAQAFCGLKAAISSDTAVFFCTNLTLQQTRPYVFQRVGSVWTQQAKLSALNVGESTASGSSLVINGNTLAFSVATNNGTGPNAVYVYQRSTSATGVVTWNRQARIVAPAIGDSFGLSSSGISGAANGALALEGDTLVVGASFSPTAASIDTGAAYIYKRTLNVWSLTTKLSPGAANDQFGKSVALNNGTLAVGARGSVNSATGSFANAVYVFQNHAGTAAWNQQTKINTPLGAPWGPSLDIDGDTLLVGMPSTPSLSAYIYQRVGTVWSLQATLNPLGTLLSFEAGFGAAATLKGNVAVIGAPAYNGKTGRVFIYSRAGTVWTQKALLADPNIAELSGYGCSLDISGRTLVVGSPLGLPVSRGSTLVYRLPVL
jgi:FG-GAP repeat